jgi:hypothetical protein
MQRCPLAEDGAFDGDAQPRQWQVGNDDSAARDARQVERGPARTGADLQQPLARTEAKQFAQPVGLTPGGPARCAMVAAEKRRSSSRTAAERLRSYTSP